MTKGTLSRSDEAAWRGTLAIGVVVAGIVWGLLEVLRRAVDDVERGVDEVWAAGQRVARNTQTTHLLGETSKSAAQLLAGLDGNRLAKEITR